MELHGGEHVGQRDPPNGRPAELAESSQPRYALTCCISG
jgi:hypothetical protein